MVVGVSGGADSVCLLFLLCEYRSRVAFDLCAVHVHHGIRQDADRDEAFVRELCDELSVPLTVRRYPVPEIAKNRGISEEEAGRFVRYEAFEECARARGSAPVTGMCRIALAHHMNDRAETMLFHLFRGSGSRGLGSIRPMRKQGENLWVIRPLLCLERQEIECFLEERGRVYCEDTTNGEDAYARNRIRHHLLPYAEAEISHGAVRHLCRAAEMLELTEDYLEKQTEEAMGECVRGNGVDVGKLVSQHPLIARRILHKMLLAASPAQKDIEAVHVEACYGLFFSGTGKHLDLPFGICARREYGKVFIEKSARREYGKAFIEKSAGPGAGEGGKAWREEDFVSLPSPDFESERILTFREESFAVRFLKREPLKTIPEKTYTKWFDYDKIKANAVLRTRRTGDYLLIQSGDGTVRKRIKDYMITEKIPRELRESQPLLADGDHILWIPGYRISEYYKVSEDTETVLEIEWLGKETEEERWNR